MFHVYFGTLKMLGLPARLCKASAEQGWQTGKDKNDAVSQRSNAYWDADIYHQYATSARLSHSDGQQKLIIVQLLTKKNK